jgi:hypothetical protein
VYRHCKVTEVVFEGEATSLRETQLVPFAQQFTCPFCHKSEVLPISSGTLTCALDLVPADFFLLLEGKMLSKKADFRTLRISLTWQPPN